MNTTSKATTALAATSLALALSGCLPGPWDYAPANAPIFRGISVSAYAVADRPVTDVCFERQLSLLEASTDAAPFYDSALVTITGVFSNGGQTLALQPKDIPPNCFIGAAAAKFVRGNSYTLSARFVWDSAGTEVVSVLSSTAKVPLDFSIKDTAAAPAYAIRGDARQHPFDPAGFLPLPYKNGDSVFYLPAGKKFGNLAEMSHFYSSRRSADVKGVLITRRFDTTESRPETSFDTIGGFVPTVSDFYQPGNMNRLIFYSDFPNSNGRSVFDSLGVVNVWFWSGRNRLFFYGAEGIYADYQDALGEAEGNAKIKLPTNVTGGRGFFAGMVVDSFDVYLKLDGLTQNFPYRQTRAVACEEKGWYDSRDCIGYYREYCRDTAWSEDFCLKDAIYTSMDPVEKLTMPADVREFAEAWAAGDSVTRVEVSRRYCIDHDYPADVPACAPVQTECENGESRNACKEILWKRCELGYWKLPACDEGIKSYCGANRTVAKTLCRDVPNP